MSSVFSMQKAGLRSTQYRPLHRSVCLCLCLILKYGCAVRATGSIDGYLGLAVRAYLGGRCRCSSLFLIGELLLSKLDGSVECLEYAEEHECHDQEVDQGGYHVVGKSCYVLEIIGFSPCHEIEYGVDKVIGNCGHYASERTTYDDTDCHVDDVATEGKILELLNKLFHTFISLSKYIYIRP